MMCGSAIAVEYGCFQRADSTESWSHTVNLAEGDVFIYLNAYRGTNGENQQETFFNYTNSLTAFTIKLDTVEYTHSNHECMRTICGPCTLTPSDSRNQTVIVNYKIIRASEATSPTPLNIISLPADNNGDLDLLIETSTDLQSWTPIYSDSIGATGTASFIRTRLINN